MLGIIFIIFLSDINNDFYFSARQQQQQTSPFKRPLGLAHLATANGGGNSLSENSSCTSSSSGSGMAGSSSLQVSSEPSGSEHGFHSGHLPTIADVRSPDVLHPTHGPCDCLTHPLHVSSYTIVFFGMFSMLKIWSF